MAYDPRTKRPASIESLVKWIRYRMRQDDDAVIAIVGGTGSGKSTLARLLMRVIQDHPVVPSLQFIWAQAQITESARTLREYSCMVVDEALAAGGNRRRAMSKDNVELMEHLNTCRTFHHCTLFCTPQFADLDMSVQTRCLGVIEVYQRGHFRWYELVKDTDVLDRGVYPVLRFEDQFPDDTNHRLPEAVKLRKEYDELKMKYSHQGSDNSTPVEREMVQRFRKKIRELWEEHDTSRRIPR